MARYDRNEYFLHMRPKNVPTDHSLEVMARQRDKRLRKERRENILWAILAGIMGAVLAVMLFYGAAA